MKTTDLKSALAISDDIQAHCYDKVVDTRSLSVSYGDAGFSINSNVGSIEIADQRVLTQVAHRVKVPISYLSRLTETDPELAARCLTSGLHNYGGEGREAQLRIYRPEGAEQRLRALVSSKYLSIPNSEILRALDTELDSSKVLIQGAFVDEYGMNVLGRYTYGNEGAQVGDIFPGFAVTNDEQGLGAFEVLFRLFRLWCSNGAVMELGGYGSETRMIHAGRTIDSNFYVQQYVRSQTNGFVNRMVWTGSILSNAIDTKVDVNGLYHGLRKEQCFNQAIMPDLFKSYDIEKRAGMGSGANLFGAVNGITRTARDLPEVREQVKFERLAGELLEATETRLRRLESVGRKYIEEAVENEQDIVLSMS